MLGVLFLITHTSKAVHKYEFVQARMKSYIADLRDAKSPAETCKKRQTEILNAMLTTESRDFWDNVSTKLNLVCEFLAELRIYSQLSLQVIDCLRQGDLFIFCTWSVKKGAFMFSVGYSKWDYASCSYAQSDDAADDTMWRMKNEPAEFWENLRINRQNLKPQFRSLMEKA